MKTATTIKLKRGSNLNINPSNSNIPNILKQLEDCEPFYDTSKDILYIRNGNSGSISDISQINPIINGNTDHIGLQYYAPILSGNAGQILESSGASGIPKWSLQTIGTPSNPLVIRGGVLNSLYTDDEDDGYILKDFSDDGLRGNGGYWLTQPVIGKNFAGKTLIVQCVIYQVSESPKAEYIQSGLIHLYFTLSSDNGANEQSITISRYIDDTSIDNPTDNYMYLRCSTVSLETNADGTNQQYKFTFYASNKNGAYVNKRLKLHKVYVV